MKRFRLCSTLWLISFLVSGNVLLQAQTTEVTLAQQGRANAVIVTAEQTTPAARLAALELQYHIEKITGAVLPIRTDRFEVKGNCILVGESEATRKLGLKGKDFAAQEYLIRFLPKTIVLMGRDWQDTPANRKEAGRGTNFYTLQQSRHKIEYLKAIGRDNQSGLEKLPLTLPGIFDDQATCYATYDFLERFCGVRWYGPTELNTIFPNRKTLTVAGDEIRRSPALKHRVGIGGGWPIIKAQWNNPNPDQLNLYWRRLRLGGEKWAGNHSFRSYYDRFLKKNPNQPELFEAERPEFFAVGWSTGERQMCYTNQALIQQVAQDARDYFDGKGLKGLQPAMGDYFVIVPMDNANWCKCEHCQAILAKDAENKREAHFHSGTATHYLFNFVNAVAREVKKTHPDKFISTLAYHVYAFKPTEFELESNVAVAPCLQVRNYWAPRIRDLGLGFYKKWVESKDRPIYLWNYYCFPMEPAVIQGWHCFPGFSAHRLGNLIKMYHADGVRGVFLCGIGEQVDYYLTMKMYDQPELDVDELLDEFFSNYFGSAAEPVKKFYIRIEEIFNDTSNYPEEVALHDKQFHQTEEIAWKYLGTKERMEELGKLIEQAKTMTVTDTEKARLATWEIGVWQYMVQGRKKYLAK